LSKVHRTPQCQNCWRIFADRGGLEAHLGGEICFRDLDIEKKEDIDDGQWMAIQSMIGTLGDYDKVEKKTGISTWMTIFDILFPDFLHPNLVRPTHPGKCGPELGAWVVLNINSLLPSRRDLDAE
jgi:hypothetical protein